MNIYTYISQLGGVTVLARSEVVVGAFFCTLLERNIRNGHMLLRLSLISVLYTEANTDAPITAAKRLPFSLYHHDR